MDRDARWLTRYDEVMRFIEREQRNPSKYYDEGKVMALFLKRNRKMMDTGELAEPRLGLFKELLALCEQYKRKNQWV